MANKVNVLDLDVNVSALITKLTETKAKIDELKQAQKDLVTANKGTSDAFTQNAVELQRLQTSYNAQKNVVAQLTNENSKFAQASAAIASAISQENSTIAQARANNAQLLTLRNQVNTKTVEGKQALADINAKLDENNNYIKSNVSALEQQKISIGDYKGQIKEAFQNINVFNGGLSGFMARSQAAGGVGNLLKNSFMGLTEGIIGTTRATLAFIATPIGAIIAAVVVVATALYNIFKNFSPVINPIKDAMAALGAVFEVIKTTIFNLVTGAKSLTEIFTNFGGAMRDAAKDAADLAAAQRKLAKQQNELEVDSAKASTQIQKLILQSKDRTKTEEERIALINKAQKIEEDIFKRKEKLNDDDIKNQIKKLAEGKMISEEDMKLLEKGGVAYAYQIKNKYNLDKEEIMNLKEKLVKKEELAQEDIQIQEKAQNRKNLLAEKADAEAEKAKEEAKKKAEENQKKAQDARQKALDDAAKLSKAELDLFISQQGTKAKSMKEQLDFEQKVYEAKLKINQKEYEASKKTEADKLQLQINNNNAKTDLLKAQADIAYTAAQKELKDFIDANKSKLDNTKFINDELYNQEINRLNRISEAEARIQTERYAKGLISLQEYQDAIALIDLKFKEDKEKVDKQKSDEDKAKNAIDFENKIATDELNSENEFAKHQEQLARQQEKELADAQKNGADTQLIKEKYAAQEKQLDKSVTDFKISQRLAIIGGIKGLFGEESKLGKAAAIAEIGYTTFLNANKAFTQAAVFASNPLTAPLAVNANIQGGIIIATGALQAAKVAGLKLAKGAVDIDGAGTTTSDSIPAMLSRGESVINANATQKWKPLLSYINSTGLSNNANSIDSGYFATTTAINSNNQQSIDYDLLASKMAEANRSIPAPVVSVHDINYQQQNYVRVVDFANH
jgi:hypothetical protein